MTPDAHDAEREARIAYYEANREAFANLAPKAPFIVSVQPSLFDLAPETTTEPGLVCLFNEPWTGDHPLCEAEADRLCALFEASVAAGEYDARGHKLRVTQERG